MTVGAEPFTNPPDPDQFNVEPVDVRIIEDTTSVERVAPDFGSSGTFTLGLAGLVQPVPLLQRRIKRSKARIIVMSMGGTTPAGSASINAFGNQTNPGVNTVLATAVVPNAGTYLVNWSEILAGTLSNTDRSNVALQVNGVTVATSVNGLNVGTIYPQTPVQITVPAGATVQMLILAANAAAVYTGQFSLDALTSLGAASAAVFHNRAEPLQNPNPPAGVGVQVAIAPFEFDWESQQPLWGVGIGGNPVVAVIDETYE